MEMGQCLCIWGQCAVIGANKPSNLVHIVINNGAHETVGGLPTVASEINLVKMAEACGYPYAVRVSEFEQLDKELQAAKERRELTLIEVECAIGAREAILDVQLRQRWKTKHCCFHAASVQIFIARQNHRRRQSKQKHHKCIFCLFFTHLKNCFFSSSPPSCPQFQTVVVLFFSMFFLPSDTEKIIL